MSIRNNRPIRWMDFEKYRAGIWKRLWAICTYLAGDNGDTFVVDGITYQFNTSATIAISSTTLGLAAKYDFEINEKSNFFVKAGFHNWETELKVSVGTASASVTTDGSDTMYGLGAEYKLNEQFSLIAGYDNYKLDSENVSFLNVGAKFQFK